MVLMMSSDGRQNAVRDQGRLRTLVQDSNDRQPAVLGFMAEATLAGSAPVRRRRGRSSSRWRRPWCSPSSRTSPCVPSTPRSRPSTVQDESPDDAPGWPRHPPPDHAAAARPGRARHVGSPRTVIGRRVRMTTAPTDERVLYIHVMKTGGTTLMQHLRENIPPDELYPDPELDMSQSTRRAPSRCATSPCATCASCPRSAGGGSGSTPATSPTWRPRPSTAALDHLDHPPGPGRSHHLPAPPVVAEPARRPPSASRRCTSSPRCSSACCTTTRRRSSR